ncbi:Uncharacterized protein APZ42_032944 [Daphnia magna]|uniref:Retrotransposon gag domain-containing protein n=1 Tax=Daphnia magna TaxID=35525 RepID=A0A164LJF3_9CRUS|nr:Uncharacterized protein APZ42_032944 [Daphnia magna]
MAAIGAGAAALGAAAPGAAAGAICAVAWFWSIRSSVSVARSLSSSAVMETLLYCFILSIFLQLLPATATPPSKKVVTWQIHRLETFTFGGPNETLEEKFLVCASFASCKCSTLLSTSLQATDIGKPSSNQEPIAEPSQKKRGKQRSCRDRRARNNQKFEGERTRLNQKLNTAENQIKQVSETAEQLQKEIKVLADRLDKATTEKINLKKNLLDFTSKNKNLEKELQELQNRVQRQENQTIIQENRGKEYKKLQVKFIETEDSNDSRLDKDEPGEITKLVGDINELILPTDSGVKSLHYELEIKQTNDFEQKIENLKTQIEHLNKKIIYLEKENQQLKKKVDMGVTQGDEETSKNTTQKTFANTSKKNPKDNDIPTTEQDDEDAKKVNRYFTQPLVKALGELFSIEDKKAIPIFKGKSTDKLISEWLRGAEHVARNNEWDDNKKIRFFSDRLKGEAFEWHENYAEEEGDDLNSQDWKEALITRFQDTYDLATLEKKPKENCRAFVSRLNNLYDTNAENTEDFDALCKQLFISEKILHTKEATDDKEMSAVIAEIMHHEKQQDDKIQLLEQKLSEALSELKFTNTKRESSQENDVTIAATDQYEKGRPRSIITPENQAEKELSVKTETTAPIAEIKIHQDEEIIILQDTGNPDFHLTNVPHIGTNTPTGSDVEVEIPKLIRIPVKIFNKEIIALVDTGAATSLVSSKILDTLECNEYLKQVKNTNTPIFRMVSGQELKSIGKFEFSVVINDYHIFNHHFYVMNNLNEQCILGLHFLSNNNVKINTRNRQICHDHFGVEHNFGSNTMPIYSVTFSNAGIHIPLNPIDRGDEDLTQQDYRNLQSFTKLDFNNKTNQIAKIAENVLNVSDDIQTKIEILLKKHEGLFADQESDLGLAT